MRKTIKLFSLMALFAVALAVSPAMAQTAAATPAATAAATAAPTPVVVMDGLVDSYYAYNFTDPSSFTTGGQYFYNNQANSFTLGIAEMKASATLGNTSGHLTLEYGQEASLAPTPLIDGLNVLQAYVSYNPGLVTINAGRFVTWMGYEVIESTGNWNYSHSLLFGALPFWHTGVSVNYAPSTIFNATVYDVDGPWQSTAANVNGKDLGLELALTPDSVWGFTFNGIMSPAYTALYNSTNLVGELIVTYKPSAWNFALDAQYGTSSVPSGATYTPSYVGIAVYGKYQIQSDWDAVLRLEYVSDPDNSFAFYGNGLAAGKAFTGDEATLTVEHDFTTNMITRAEVRMDMANYNSSAADIFPTGTTPSSSEVTGTLSAAFTY